MQPWLKKDPHVPPTAVGMKPWAASAGGEGDRVKPNWICHRAGDGIADGIAMRSPRKQLKRMPKLPPSWAS